MDFIKYSDGSELMHENKWGFSFRLVTKTGVHWLGIRIDICDLLKCGSKILKYKGIRKRLDKILGIVVCALRKQLRCKLAP